MLSFDLTASYTDFYEITMGQTYFLEGCKDVKANFDYFFRKIPNNGGYVIFAGLNDLLQVLQDLKFSNNDLLYLKSLGLHPSYLNYLDGFRFHGDVYSAPEGEVVFPNCPLLRVEGNIIEAQLIESVLLNILNFQSLIATKASRIRCVAGKKILTDFGMRRAQGLASVWAAKAAVIGGFNSTSNVYAAKQYNIPVTGTMAHSFVESYDEEIEAFRAFARSRPHDCVFLVDTYDTLESGVTNAIVVAKEMEMNGQRAKAIRLDSGDLAYLSKAARAKLDDAGLHYVGIVASNQLDEYVVKSLLEQQSPIDVFGVGTNLVTGKPDAALDGVYKLTMSAGKPRLKLSEDPKKVILPGIKQVMRLYDERSMFYGADAVMLASESNTVDTIYHPFEIGKSMRIGILSRAPLLQKVMENGKRLEDEPSLAEIAKYAQERLDRLPEEYKRFENPHLYKVGITDELMKLRETLRRKYQQKINARYAIAK